MHPLADQFGRTTAYLYKRMIVDTECKRVLGLVIGNCVFGNAAEAVGKLFNNTLRDIEGRIVARLQPEEYHPAPSNGSELIKATWDMLMHVKSHVCPWIPEAATWSHKDVFEMLGTSRLADQELRPVFS